MHIQQVHKLEPENLPRIDNALPGRDGYEVEIFGMEGIPAPDVADYKRRKEIELGLSAGSISQPQAKRPKIENRALTEEELKAQLEAHKALMGANDGSSSVPMADSSTGGVYGAPAQAYAVPPPIPGLAPGMMPPPFFPGGPPPGFPGQPPFPPFPGMGFPPGPPPGFPLPPGFPPGGPPPGVPSFPPPGIRPMLPPPNFVPSSGAPPFPPPGAGPPGISPPGVVPPPSQSGASSSPSSAPPPPPSAPPTSQPVARVHPTQPTLPNPALAQTNAPFKKKTDLKYPDPNFSPDEKRAYHPKYYFDKGPAAAPVEESRGKKRARAEDFL